MFAPVNHLQRLCTKSLPKCHRFFVQAVKHKSGGHSHATVHQPPQPIKLKKILIANRGEIARRVIRTAKRLGIRTVAVYSDADINSDHVKEADEAYHIGPSQASLSYLSGENIINACKRTGAQAVHPGYGFLSENLEFCQLCKEHGIIFIGPPPNAIRAMGSKSESKEIMIKAGVPVTPGYHGGDQSNAKLVEEAQRIGVPLMIKAVSGGGGKGMRAVHDMGKFLESLESCRREAKKSFNDDAVLLEKLIQSPIHVEVQIFGGPDGKAVHLLERDCSVQRRHQKVLEEAPAPNLDTKTRTAMWKAAVACAEAVGYVGAGTVEFLVDSKTKDFYFCEMNTRLQVEHPVTEMVTGTDLVEWQLLVAAGFPIPLTQEQIIGQYSGWAIEARLYAENPLKDFLPAIGKIVHLNDPAVNSAEPGVRADIGVSAGSSISTFYDPMIGKLIAHGSTRDEAIAKLERALRQFQVAGLANNIDFLIQCLHRPEFYEARATTAFFEHNMSHILKSLNHVSPQEESQFFVFAAVALYNSHLMQSPLNPLWSDPGSQNWRQFASVKQTFDLRDKAEDISVSLQFDQSTKSIAISPGKHENVEVDVLSARQTAVLDDVVTWVLKLSINGSTLQGTVVIHENPVTDAEVIDVWLDGRDNEEKSHHQLTFPHKKFGGSLAASGNPVVMSPMPGKVVKVVASDGARVKVGDTILILEAMKMEHVVTAPSDGTVKVYCSLGGTVAEGTKIAEVISD